MITPFSAWWIGRGAPGVQGYRGVCRTRRGAGGYVLTLPSVLLLLRTGVGLPPYRGRTVRGTVRFNPRRSHLDFWPARPGRTVRGTVRSNPKRSYLDSFRLFWKSRGKSTRGFGKNTRWLRLDLIEVSPGHFDSGLRGLVKNPPIVAQHAPCGRLLLPPATVWGFGC